MQCIAPRTGEAVHKNNATKSRKDLIVRGGKRLTKVSIIMVNVLARDYSSVTV